MLQNVPEGGASAIHSRYIGLDGMTIACFSDITHEYQGAVLILERNFVKIISVNRAAINHHRIFVVSQLYCTARQDHIGGLQSIEYVLGRQPSGIEAVWYQV